MLDGQDSTQYPDEQLAEMRGNFNKLCFDFLHTEAEIYILGESSDAIAD